MDYKKYSLGQLENWVNDAISCSGASPQEIFDTIKNAVEEEYYIHKHQTSLCYELLAHLNGNGKSILQNMETCDKDSKSPECQKAWNDFWEEHYYPEEYKEKKVTKWILPLELDGITGDLFVKLPDDLIEQVGWKEGDQIEYVPDENGFYVMRKVNGIK